ncbi:MAG: hypothetical protein K8S62_02265 [Candidatus Sabulitectum sp.]|nr:hypothetical protein [Candidatus Sabulitectum sp.]
MPKIFDAIKKDAEQRVLSTNRTDENFLMYLDRQVFKKGSELDIVTKKIKFAQPTNVVFVDEAPMMNFAHPCNYLLYNASTGEFIKKVDAEFPYFMFDKPDSIELFRTCRNIEALRRKKRIRVQLDPGKLSAYRKLAPFPLKFSVTGTRYAILFSGASNGRHVNDMEFLYRTLLDVYGYDPANIFVLNHDGTLNYNTMSWETPPADGFGPDGSAWRMTVNGAGNRTDFQSVIATLAAKIKWSDCLLIHANNHGGWNSTAGDGYLCTQGSSFYAADFAADLATLPKFKSLLVAMEQCHAGSFMQPIMNNSPADKTVFQAAVPWNGSSAGSWPFDPWAEMWISAMAGVRGDGSALAISPDDNLDSLISSWEAYDYAIAIDNPVMDESSVDLSKSIFLSKCSTTVKLYKERKEFKEFKEYKEPKEFKEYKEPKEFKEYKEFKEPKEYLEPKQLLEPKTFMEPKMIVEHGMPEFPEDPFTGIRKMAVPPGTLECLAERLERLEESVEKLTPFIDSELRPDLEKKVFKNRKKK